MNFKLSFNRLIIALILFVPIQSAAQTTSKNLTLKQQGSDKELTIKAGKILRVRTRGKGKIVGRFEKVSDSFLYLTRDTIAVAEINSLSFRYTGTQIAGAFISTIGTGILTLGGYMILSAILDDDALTSLVLGVVGVVFTVAGLVIDLIGVPMFFIGKVIKLNRAKGGYVIVPENPVGG